jgi:hypothetical protein
VYTCTRVYTLLQRTVTRGSEILKIAPSYAVGAVDEPHKRRGAEGGSGKPQPLGCLQLS